MKTKRKKKNTHGGARPNSGPEAKHGPTKVMRVPLSLVPQVLKLIKEA